VHHGFEYTFEEGLDAMPEVIRHIETYDVTTIRASTPMYLLARRIKAMGVKMVLSGEGSRRDLRRLPVLPQGAECARVPRGNRAQAGCLHNYDCLRANKAMMAWGVEARVPFLDLEFLDVAMRMDAKHKMAGKGRIDGKAVLREAFDGALPESILWRQKEQFSDGVGYGWIDGLKAHAEAQVSDREFAAADKRFPLNPPQPRKPISIAPSSSSIFPAMPVRRRYPAESRLLVPRLRRLPGIRPLRKPRTLRVVPCRGFT
jgi:asparagine synthase (glutamine-hydrolysing)